MAGAGADDASLAAVAAGITLAEGSGVGPELVAVMVLCLAEAGTKTGALITCGASMDVGGGGGMLGRPVLGAVLGPGLGAEAAVVASLADEDTAAAGAALADGTVVGTVADLGASEADSPVAGFDATVDWVLAGLAPTVVEAGAGAGVGVGLAAAAGAGA